MGSKILPFLLLTLILCYGFRHVDRAEATSTPRPCVPGVKFYDDVSFDWRNCSTCPHEGSQFWQCEICCIKETVTAVPPIITWSPSRDRQTSTQGLHGLMNLRESTTETPNNIHQGSLTTMITGLGMLLALVVITPAVIIAVVMVVKRKSRTGNRSQTRIAEEGENDARMPTQCTDKNKSTLWPPILHDDDDDDSQS